jgi:uncharacterized protein
MIMKKFFILFLALLYVGNPGLKAQDSTKIDMNKMKTYYFVMLIAGKKRNQDTATIQIIQRGHLANITRLVKDGKLIVAGPFLDDVSWRGIFIFDANSKEEVEKLLLTDPAITSGRLDYEIHPWMTQKGTCFK